VHQHAQDSPLSQGAPARDSSFMDTLSSSIEAVSRGVLNLLPEGRIGDSTRRGIATRIVTLFVRHVSIIRPLEEAGKLGVAQDLARLELAIHPLCVVRDASRCGGVFAALRHEFE